MNYKIIKPVALLMIATGLFTLSGDADAQTPVCNFYESSGYCLDNNIFVTDDGNKWEYDTQLRLHNNQCVTITFNDNSTPDYIYDDIITKISPCNPVITWDIPLTTELQVHILNTCEEYDLDPRIVVAIIQVESNYNPNVIGDEGRSYGLMQIQPQWHKNRMEKLGCTDLLDPYQNITVGANILKEMMNKYDTTEEALTAYNAGCAGAYNLYFSKGIKANEYARTVMEIADNLEK